ncbi:Hypothetical predicted protein, partial [Paramuricea clavata]
TCYLGQDKIMLKWTPILKSVTGFRCSLESLKLVYDCGRTETYLQIDTPGEKYLAHEHILKTVGHLNCHACSLCG